MANNPEAKKFTPPNVLPQGSDVSRVIAPEISPPVAHPSGTKLKPPTSRRQIRTHNVPFSVYAPSPNPVVLSELLDEVALTIRRFVILDKDQADAAALWVAHTYMVDLFT